MAEAPPRVWLNQAISDWDASRKLLDENDGSTFCQSIGKYRQAVEKVVKSVLAALRNKGFLKSPTPRGHSVEEEMRHIASTIARMPRPGHDVELTQHAQNLLSAKNVGEINELMRLAPRWPAPGALFPRNTEYPFEISANVWVAPADASAFDLSALRKFRHLAYRVVGQASKIVSAAEHKPR